MIYLILAKIHMVTKLFTENITVQLCLILAKIHMVTKLNFRLLFNDSQSYSSKNPYGNKTVCNGIVINCMSYSSKNPYGNKTHMTSLSDSLLSYSSKNPYGNKTEEARY